MPDDALGGAAAQGIENAVMPRRRHADQVGVEFDGRVDDRLHDAATRWIVARDIARWDGEIAWLSLYFSVAVWTSLALCGAMT